MGNLGCQELGGAAPIAITSRNSWKHGMAHCPQFLFYSPQPSQAVPPAHSTLTPLPPFLPLALLLNSHVPGTCCLSGPSVTAQTRLCTHHLPSAVTRQAHASSSTNIVLGRCSCPGLLRCNPSCASYVLHLSHSLTHTRARTQALMLMHSHTRTCTEKKATVPEGCTALPCSRHWMN